MSPGGTNDEQTTMEDRATQPLGCWKAEFRNNITLDDQSGRDRQWRRVCVSECYRPTWPESQHAPSLYCHPLPAHKQVLTGRSFQLKKDLIILGKYSRRFQNPRGDSDVDWGQTCGLVSTLHHRSSGAWGRIGGCKWASIGWIVWGNCQMGEG